MAPMTRTLRRRAANIASVTALALMLAGALAATQGVAAGAPSGVAVAKPRPPRPSGSATQPPTPTPTTSPTVVSASPAPTPTTSSPAAPNPTSTGSTASPSTETACTAALVQFAGEGYCPAHLSYVRATAYGLGHRVVLKGVQVTAVNGATITVEGGSPCYPADTFCGAILAAVPVTFPTGVRMPSYGDFVNVYGVTAAGSLIAVGHEFLFWCDPSWAC